MVRVMIPNPKLLIADDWSDYGLVDSGHGRKLERVGPYRVIRPESQALWAPGLSEGAWTADATFQAREGDDGGNWQRRPGLPESWPMRYRSLRFVARCTPFRHLGFFPEQSVHWRWIAALVQKRCEAAGESPTVLNLFGYSGLASLVAAEAGARVTHVDASKKAIGYATENQATAELSALPIRWIVDDAVKFAYRDVRRGRRYDGIILDPPKFGRGPKGEVWRFQSDLPELLSVCRQLLTDRPLFIVMTAYAVQLSFLALHNVLAEVVSDLPGLQESGEMLVSEESCSRLLPTAIFSRWGSDPGPRDA